MAYKFANGGTIYDDIELWAPGDAGYNALNPYRNSMAKYVLPDYNEWYKAAYYDPNSGLYYDFPTGSNTAPTAVASGTASGTAVYNQNFYAAVPADVDQAGGLSPYGVMGLGGNVYEWEETSFDLLNSSGSSNRAYRGGNFNIVGSASMRSTNRLFYDYPGAEYYYDVGFRVASVTPSSPPPTVPEPTSMAIFGLGALGMAYRARRKAKAKAKQA